MDTDPAETLNSLPAAPIGHPWLCFQGLLPWHLHRSGDGQASSAGLGAGVSQEPRVPAAFVARALEWRVCAKSCAGRDEEHLACCSGGTLAIVLQISSVLTSQASV